MSMWDESVTDGSDGRAPDSPGPPAGSLAELLVAELRSIRKGRGVWAGNFDQRLGPALRELAADRASEDTDSRRHAFVAVMRGASARLPADLRTAMEASLALSAETVRMAQFKDRVSWLASKIDRLDRTALRRIEQAERLLAEELASELRRRRGSTATAPQGWYLEELRTVLRMDTAAPESHEHRRVIATRDGLRDVMAWLDLPSSEDQPRPTLAVEVLYGGRLVRREEPSRGRFQLVLRLPRDLQAGDAHEFGLILRVPAGQPMRPHYIFTPECRCELFSLRIRFDLSRPPRWVRRVAGETVRMFDNAGAHKDLITLDDAGELSLQFVRPTLYLGYGAQWSPQGDV